MKKLLFVSILLFSTLQFLFSQIQEKKAFSIGETIELKSDILKEDRTINVYLPNGYSNDSLKQYPVIYLLDGSKDEDFIHIAGLVQFCSFSWINIIPESIVIGIGNIDRKKDFTYPTKNEKDILEFPTTGSSENFIKFIENELQPMVDKTYNVTDEKTIIGQSLGGLLATEILFKKPQLFQNYIIVSPSLWWDDESLLEFEMNEPLKDKSIYIGVGKEGKVMERVANELHNKIGLMKKDKCKLYFSYFEKQDHGDALHLAAYDAFEKIFDKKVTDKKK